MGAKSLLRAFDLSPLVASNGPTTSSRASAISRERRHAYRPAPGSAPRAGSGAYLPQQREKPFPVLVVHEDEDRVALVPAGGDVPDGARNLRPEEPAHSAAISQWRYLTPAFLSPYRYNPEVTGSVRPLFWVASARKDLRAFPDQVQDVFGFALYLAQVGEKHLQAKPLKGFHGSGVLEVVEDHMGNAYRAVYTVRLREACLLYTSDAADE